jgi:hypothetical protein
LSEKLRKLAMRQSNINARAARQDCIHNISTITCHFLLYTCTLHVLHCCVQCSHENDAAETPSSIMVCASTACTAEHLTYRQCPSNDLRPLCKLPPYRSRLHPTFVRIRNRQFLPLDSLIRRFGLIYPAGRFCQWRKCPAHRFGRYSR